MLDILLNIAPTLGKAVTGDVGGAAQEALKAFGIPNGDKNDLEEALKNATPEQLAQLKELDNDYKIKLRKLDIQEAKVYTDDIANARDMNVNSNSLTDDVIGIAIVLGFFVVLYYKITSPVKSDPTLDVLFGTLTGITMAVVSFYFGSSKRK